MKFQPMGNNLLVKLEKTDTMSSGGIIIPTENITSIGWVVEVGPKVVDVKQGDYVRLEAFGTEVQLEGGTFQIVSEDTIAGVITGK
jgi:co-chaperonin GroES (HSP10)